MYHLEIDWECRISTLSRIAELVCAFLKVPQVSHLHVKVGDADFSKRGISALVLCHRDRSLLPKMI